MHLNEAGHQRFAPAFLKGWHISFAILFLVVEMALRGLYVIRASSVERIPLPYMTGDQYGAVPPWWDTFRILEPDEALIW